MYELHENEQYFFDEATLEHLADFVGGYSAPCCVCAPLLGRRLTERGVPVAVLDIDERFADLDGFQRFDVQRPEWLGETFDLVLCDPPFYNVSLSRLFAALRTLSRNDFAQRLMVSYLVRRSTAVCGTFAPFGLRPSGYRPAYQTVQPGEKNDIEFYTNLPEEELERLRLPS